MEAMSHGHGGDVTWPQRPRHSQIDGESKSHICPYFLHTLWALPLQYSFYHILCVDVSSSDIYERVEKSMMITRLISDEHTTRFILVRVLQRVINLRLV
jgi:hypothetical protein